MTRQFALEVLKLTLFRPLGDSDSISTMKDATLHLRNSVLTWYQVWENAKAIFSRNEKEYDKYNKLIRNAELTYQITGNSPNFLERYNFRPPLSWFTWDPYDKVEIAEAEWQNLLATYDDWKIEAREAIMILISNKDFDGNPWEIGDKTTFENQILELLKTNINLQNSQHEEVLKRLDLKSYEPLIFKLTHFGKEKEILIIPASKKPGKFNFTPTASYENVIAAIKGVLSIRELYDTKLFVKDSGTPYSSFESFEESLRGRSKRLKT